MDFNKFKNSGDNSDNNTFEGDESLNPYAGSMVNYFENHQGDDENGSIEQGHTSGSYNVSNYGNRNNYNYESNPYENGIEYGRRAPVSSKGKTVAMLSIGFGLIFAYMGYAAYYHMVKNKKETENVPIVQGYDSSDPAVLEIEERVKTKEEFEEKLKQMIDDGVDDLYIGATNKVTENDVEEVCQSLDLDPFLYKYSGYIYSTSTERDGDGPEYDTGDVGINVQIDPTIEGLVYLNLTEGKEIPADNIKASKLKVSCETFLNQNITDSMSDYEKELAIHDYLIYNCDYASDISDEKDEFSAYGVMLNKKAVCEGYSRAAALLLRLSNVETELISGTVEDDPSNAVTDENHMWNLVKIDGKWYHMDATWDDPIGGEEWHMYMNLDDSIISTNHEWDKSKYESCTSMDANYYSLLGTYFTDDDSFQTYVRAQLEEGNRTTIECIVGDVDLSEEALGFIFEYDGVSSYYLSWGDIEGFKHLVIHINGN